MSLDTNTVRHLSTDANAFYKMVKSTHLFHSLSYVEHLKLMPTLSLQSAEARQGMIDTNSQATKPPTRSLSSPGSNIKRETMQAGSRASQKTSSPGQLSHKSADSPLPRALSVRSNSSPISSYGGSGSLQGRVSPGAVLRPLEIQSPNSINMQLPPTCGAKQLAKLKRFLTTLQQFGSDISTEIGERVRALVLALVNSQLSIEDFHSKLQETTNFPLKPFVIPFLKATLPSLQRELMQCAQISRQSPQQYLANNERAIFDAGESKKDSTSSISPEFRDDSSQSSKRKISPRTSLSDEIPPPKRLLRDSSPTERASSRSPSQSALTDVEPGLLMTPTEKRFLTDRELLPPPPQIKLDDISRLFRARLENADLGLINPLRPSGSSSSHKDNMAAIAPSVGDLKEDDNWKRVKVMLADVSSLVEKTKSAVLSLQESRIKESQEFSVLMRRHAEGIDQDFKKRTGEIMTQTIRQSEDRIAEVKRRADEMVNEVKRQAIMEIHQAVTAAELKANELVGQERVRMENVLTHIKKTAKDEANRLVNKQSDLPENCWNCGRKASETCSGCNKARYCGQFCQHKDWDRHHNACGGVKEKEDKGSDTMTNTKVVETKKEKD